MDHDRRISFGEWLASRPFGHPVPLETALEMEQAWNTAIERGLTGVQALQRLRAGLAADDSDRAG